MRRFCNTLKDIRGIQSRVDRERIKEPVEIVPVCSQCNKFVADRLLDGKVVKGIAIGNVIYCKDHGFAIMRIQHPTSTEKELEARLVLYKGVGVSQLYLYSHNGLTAEP